MIRRAHQIVFISPVIAITALRITSTVKASTSLREVFKITIPYSRTEVRQFSRIRFTRSTTSGGWLVTSLARLCISSQDTGSKS